MSWHHRIQHIRRDNGTGAYKNIKYECYINLVKAEICELGNNGDIQKIEKPLHYINEEDFDLSDGPHKGASSFVT